MFKWSCFGLAAAAVAAMLWMLGTIRAELMRTTTAVNTQLPQILEKTRESTETLAALSTDVKQLRDLVGAAGPRDKSLVVYADELLDRIGASGGTVGLSKKVFGSGLKDEQPAAEWVVAARKEALWLAFRAKSREELLERLCQNKFGSEWYIQIGESEPVALREWLSAPQSDADRGKSSPRD